MAAIIERVIYPVVDEVKETIEKGDCIVKSPGTVLYGQGAVLDSLGLVTFIVSVESRIEKEFGRSVTLATEEAFSLTRSPFRTLGTLAEYIQGLLQSGNQQ